jgi:hypothetical protein
VRVNTVIHLKPNQQLKYLNKGSAHTNACFKAIPAGVYHRLTKLTSMDENNADKCLEDIYPEHFKALRRANLITNKIPTLREEMSRVEEKLEQKRTKTREDESKKKREDLRKRSTFFCVGYSKAWITPIHKVIKEIKERFKLSWLRVSMSYHRFSNLREVFQGDLSKKLTLDVKSKDFETLECNCRLGSEKRCGYDNMCRKSIIVYKVECKETSKSTLGTLNSTSKRGCNNTSTMSKSFIPLVKNQTPTPNILLCNFLTFQLQPLKSRERVLGAVYYGKVILSVL